MAQVNTPRWQKSDSDTISPQAKKLATSRLSAPRGTYPFSVIIPHKSSVWALQIHCTDSGRIADRFFFLFQVFGPVQTRCDRLSSPRRRIVLVRLPRPESSSRLASSLVSSSGTPRLRHGTRAVRGTAWSTLLASESFVV